MALAAATFAALCGCGQTSVLTLDSNQVRITHPSSMYEASAPAERSPAASISFAASSLGGLVGQVRPDPRREDSYYPLLTRVGEGWLIYAPGLVTDTDNLAVRPPPRLGFAPR